MHPIYELLLKLQSAHLGHEAVIEIMLAILGLMVAVLTVALTLVGLVIAIVGWFGYTSIRDEATKHAEQAAEKAAKAIAASVAKEHIERLIKRDEASALVTAQTDFREPKTRAKAGTVRRRATTDSSLRKEEE